MCAMYENEYVMRDIKSGHIMQESVNERVNLYTVIMDGWIFE